MTPKRRLMWAMAFILLAGVVPRLWFIGVHGLDADELFSINFLREPTSFILATFANTTREVDGKLYYLLHQPWAAAAGITEMGLRMSNVLLDLLLGAVLMQTARAKFGGRAGLIAGGLWAANPLLVWVDGAVNKYALLGLLSALVWIAAIQASLSNRRWWALFVVSALAVLYEHVLGVIVVAGAGVVILWLCIVRGSFTGLIALVVVGIGYLPYLINLYPEISTARRLGAALPVSPLDFALRFFSALTANLTPLPVIGLWVVLAVCLALIAIGALRGSRSRTWMLLLIAQFGVTVIASGILALRQSIFESRYIAYSVPLFLLLISGGIASIGSRWLRIGLVAGLVALGAAGMQNQANPLARDDFRSAAQFLEKHADSGDIIITMGDFALPPMQYYYTGQTELVAPWHDVLNGKFARKLTQTIAGHDTVWVVLYQTNVVDPTSAFDGWLRSRYPIRTEVFPTGVTVRGYDLRPTTDTLPAEAVPLDVVFNKQVALRGYQIYEAELSARDQRLHPPSGWVHVTLYWEVLTSGVDFAPSLQLEDAVGNVWGIAFTRGSETFVFMPPAGWQPGQITRSDADVNLNPDTPPGDYQVVLRVGTSDGQTVWADAAGNQAVLVAPVKIVAATP